jgi:hypothetical protein
MPATTEIGTLASAGRDKTTVRKRPGRLATNLRGNASARMIAPRTLRFLTMLAILLMPLGMIGAPLPAAAAGRPSATMPADHCAGMSHNGKTVPAAPCCDCMVACSAIPSQAPFIQHEVQAPMAAQPAALTKTILGLHPEAATPPPRPS